MSSGETPFSDPTLKQALEHEASRLDPSPALRSSIEALFAGGGAAAMAGELASIPIHQGRPRSYRTPVLMLAAAVVVAGLSIAFFTVRHGEDDWDQEYTIAEARLWPAMASLYRPGVATTGPSSIAVSDGPALSDPRYQLLATREATLVENVPCIVRDYRREDGATFSVITTPASYLIRESHHEEEEEDESYDERVGDIRIIGGIKGNYWICIAAPANVPEDLFKDVLGRMPALEK